MKLKIEMFLAAAATMLTAASPMVSTSMSTDNGGNKLAIDAYSDGAGVLMINQASDTKFDNSAMNKLVFKYGDAAKTSNTTLKNQVNVLSPGATALEKSAASTTLEIAKVVINPPANGVSCNDGSNMTYGDAYVGGICTGIEITSCNQLHIANPALGSGIYTINNAGQTAYCDMTTDGGGWTLVFSPSANTLNSKVLEYTTPYTSGSLISVVAASSQTMIAYMDSVPAVKPLTNQYKFDTPSSWRIKEPMKYAQNDLVITYTNIATNATGTGTLKGDYSNFSNYCTDPTYMEPQSPVYGRICITGTTAPFYNGFSIGSGNFCALSNAGYNSPLCSVNKKFAIFVK